jgi:RND family efflux transporter MFP subunit
MKRTVTMSIGFVLLAGGAYGAKYYADQAERMNHVEITSELAPTRTVDVHAVTPITRPLVFRTRGVLQGIQEVRVSSEVEGRVQTRHVREGDRLEVGAALCTIDPTFHNLAVQAAQAGLDEAQATLENATAELQRLENIPDKNRAAIEMNRLRTALSRAQAARDLAQADLNRADRRLERSTIQAPISGVVSAVFFEVGELLAPAQPVVEIVNLEQMRLRIELTTLEAAQLGDRPDITVTSVALPDQQFHGELHATYPKATLTTRRIPVEILIDNAAGLLRSGTMVGCVITTAKDRPRLLIPASAVMNDFATQYCLVAEPTEDGHVVDRRQLRTVAMADSVTVMETVDGLDQGDLLILNHLQELRPGQVVDVRHSPRALSH